MIPVKFTEIYKSLINSINNKDQPKIEILYNLYIGMLHLFFRRSLTKANGIEGDIEFLDTLNFILSNQLYLLKDNLNKDPAFGLLYETISDSILMVEELKLGAK